MPSLPRRARADLHAPAGSYLSSDTIAAQASAPGGALTIVRISGPSAFAAVDAILGPEGAARAAAAPARSLFRARMPFDDALAVRFPAPESYTGEDVVELHLHGSPFVAMRALEALALAGARQALPGEFSFRAVRNGKMSIAQAEAVADLIAASNEGAVALALEKMSGAQNLTLDALAESLRALATLAEAGIDFSDQDIDEVGLPRLRLRLRPSIAALERLLASFERGRRLQEGVRAVFVGLPNAGKSSLFNALLGEDRSIVSPAAGTTRDLVHERLTLTGPRGSVTLRLEDTAGLRTPAGDDHAIEQEGIVRSRRAARDAELCVFVIDPLEAPDAAIAQWRGLGVQAERTIAVLSKGDLCGAAAIALAKKFLAPLGLAAVLSASAVTGEGLDAFVDAVTSLCAAGVARAPGEILLTRQSQARALETALGHFKRALGAPELDLFAADLRQGLHSLSPLIGGTAADDLLTRIFSDFCIGK